MFPRISIGAAGWLAVGGVTATGAILGPYEPRLMSSNYLA